MGKVMCGHPVLVEGIHIPELLRTPQTSFLKGIVVELAVTHNYKFSSGIHSYKNMFLFVIVKSYSTVSRPVYTLYIVLVGTLKPVRW